VDVSRPAPASRRRLGSLAVAVLFLGGLLIPILAPGAGADEIGDKREQARAVAAELNEIQGHLFELDRQYSEAAAALDATNGRIDEAQGRVDATTAELAEQRAQFQKFAVQAYVGGNETPEFEALLTSTGDEAPQKASYLHAATGDRRVLQDRLRATTERLNGDIADLEASKAEAQVHVDEMAAARDQSQQALDAQQAVKAQIDGELDVLVQEEQARLEAERRAQAEAQAAAQRQAAEDAARQQAAVQARTQTATTAPAPAPTAATPSAPAAPSTPTGPSAPPPTAPKAPVAPPPVGPTAPPPVSGGAGAAVAAAQSALGVPYVPGGKGMSGFDCSGLTSWAWAKGGKSLPPTTYGQWAAGQRVSLDALQPGDLVFYAGVSHVGLYVGGGSIIHAPNSRSVVRYDSVYWWGPIDGAIRP
jgi:cell wall-associated NlpC family hydrolase